MSRTLVTILSLLVIFQLALAKVLLIGTNTFISFDYVEATFTPIVGSLGEYGSLYAAEPLDACSDLTNMAEQGSTFWSSYVLIVRGGCSFEAKVRKAQKAGYKAAIVYNYDYDVLLVPMSGNSSGVHIHGVPITRASGEILKVYAGRAEVELWFILGFGTSSWSIIAINFVFLLAMSAFLATCFFIRRHRVRRRVRDLYHGSSRMPRNLLQDMPIEVFTGVLEQGSTSVTCDICIDDYRFGDKLRVLLCKHKFHAVCIDFWFGQWRSFCPVCKRNARTGNCDPLASETTPLLSPSMSFRTSLKTSYDLPIVVRAFL